MMRIIWIGLMVLFTGCVSVPMAKKFDDIQAKRFQPTPGMANVYVFRDGSFGTAVITPLELDGDKLADMAPETFAKVTLPPGKFTLKTHSENSHELALELKANKNYFVRQSVRRGRKIATVFLKAVSKDEGQDAILNCKLVKTPIL